MIETPKFFSAKNSGGIVILYAFVLILIITTLIGFMGKRVVLTLGVTADAFHEKQAFWNAYAGLNVAPLINLSEKRKILLDTGEFEITGPTMIVRGGEEDIEIKNGEAGTGTDDGTDFGAAGSYVREYIIENAGTDVLILTTDEPITVESEPAGKFIITEHANISDVPTRTIEVGEQAKFKLHFVHNMAAELTGVVSINSNWGVYQFTIKATGPSKNQVAFPDSPIEDISRLELPATYSSWGKSVGDELTPVGKRAFKTLRKIDPTSAILFVGASSNDAPVATEQTVEVNVVGKKIITLAGTDENDDPIGFIITTLPVNGALYQAPDGLVGNRITEVPTTVSGNMILQDLYRVIYVAPTTYGAGHGDFSFAATDFIQESTPVTATVNVNQVPIMEFVSDRSEITDPAEETDHSLDVEISNNGSFGGTVLVHYKIQAGEYTYGTDYTINDELVKPISPGLSFGNSDSKKSQIVKVKARPGYQGTRYVEFVLVKNPISPDLYSIGPDSVHTMVINDPLVSGAYAIEEMPGDLATISVAGVFQGKEVDCENIQTYITAGYPTKYWPGKLKYDTWVESEVFPENPEDYEYPSGTPVEILEEIYPYSFENTAEDLYINLASESPLSNMEITEPNTTNLFFHLNRIDDKLSLVFNHDDPMDHGGETVGRAIFHYSGLKGDDDIEQDDYILRDDDEGENDGANEQGTYYDHELEVRWKWAADETDGGVIDLGTIWNTSCVKIRPGTKEINTRKIAYDKVQNWKLRSASMWDSDTIKVEESTDLEFYSQFTRVEERLVIAYQPKLQLIHPINNIATSLTPTFRWKKFGRNARYELEISTNEDFVGIPEVQQTFGKFIINDIYTERDHPSVEESYVINEVFWELGQKELGGFLDGDNNPTWLEDAFYIHESSLSPLTQYYWKVTATFVDPETGDLHEDISWPSITGSFNTIE